jgi:hypothetical protein
MPLHPSRINKWLCAFMPSTSQPESSIGALGRLCSTWPSNTVAPSAGRALCGHLVFLDRALDGGLFVGGVSEDADKLRGRAP